MTLLQDASDKRPEPVHKARAAPANPAAPPTLTPPALQVVYSQSVGSSDVFLGMSGECQPLRFCNTFVTRAAGKDPSTMSCDRLTVSFILCCCALRSAFNHCTSLPAAAASGKRGYARYLVQRRVLGCARRPVSRASAAVQACAAAAALGGRQAGECQCMPLRVIAARK